ncbi:putative vomeronasal receptor-like protein 4 [Nycticebus coucang]|uniref:putative vomeronasal receptor-like protein 4 n=1 Tax=Nycticebus coucang TaxID=9470 RepID=UPI00234C439B|nr:putative vomeronasal receptor-like protein 4 [Nycticebus coucang]
MNLFFIYATIKNCLFLQIGIGISANFFLFLFCIFILPLDHRVKPTDLTICHLAFIHIVKFFIAVLMGSPELFESLNFQNDLKCKAFFYLSRVIKDLSICTTSLLSMLQAITISPSTSWLARFKHKSTDYNIHVLFFLWSLTLSFNSSMIFYTVATSNVTQTNLLNIDKYCSLSPMSSIIRGLLFTLSLARHVSFVGVMLLSSAYMAILLLRHERRSQHLHSTRLPSKASPEKRATKTILLLVSCFVVMYWVDFIISFYSIMLWAYGPVIRNVQSLVVNTYATVSPLVLLSSDKRIINILQNIQEKWHKIKIIL